MKKVLIMPFAAAVLFAAACDSSTEVDTRPLVRFLNATTGLTGSGAFTTNGKFTKGSTLALGQAACARVSAGASTSFGFGAANPAGTDLSGNALATLNNRTIIDGGNYTVVATGSAASPMMFMLDNAFSDTLATNQAAVRFVNYAPGTDSIANTYVVYKGAIGMGTIVGLSIAVGAPTAFNTVTNGSHQYSVLKLPGHIIAVEGTAGLLDLQAGSVNTIAIVPTSSGGFQLINLKGC
jgi:hypothetical protein